MADKSLPLLKVCTKCGEAKPADGRHFQRRSVGERRYFRNQCRECETKDRRDKRRLDPESANRARRASYARNPERVLAKIREYRKANASKCAKWEQQNRDRNKAAGSEYQKRRYARSDKERSRLNLAEWKKRNPDKVRAHWRRTYEKNKAKIYARQVLWLKRNPEARAAIMDRRRAREFGCDGNYTKDDVRSLLREHGRICFYCGTALTKFHVDHFLPLARGGPNDPGNLRLSCPPCNYSKGARMPWEWMPEKFLAPIST